MNTEQHLLETYGPLLSTDDLAEVFKFGSKNSVLSSISAEQFPQKEAPLQTVKSGKRRYAYYRTVARYIDQHYGSTPPAPREPEGTDACTS